MWRSIQHNNKTPLSGFLFFWNFTNRVKYVLPNISKLWSGFSLKLFVLTWWTSGFVLKQTKGGGASKFGTFGTFEIGAIWGRRRQAPPRLRPRRACQNLKTYTWNVPRVPPFQFSKCGTAKPLNRFREYRLRILSCLWGYAVDCFDWLSCSVYYPWILLDVSQTSFWSRKCCNIVVFSRRCFR